MIQRIQTIFMLLAVLFIVPLLYLPFAKITGSDEVIYSMKIWGVYAHKAELTTMLLNLLPLTFAFILSFIIPLINIFLYKKRRMQLRYNGFGILTNTIMIAVMFYFIEQTSESLSAAGAKPQYSFIIFMPALSILMLFIANRFIKKDDALIRSVDRIR